MNINIRSFGNLFGITIIMFAFVVFSCTDDSETIYPSGDSFLSIEEIVNSGELLLDFDKIADNYVFYFESDTLTVPLESIFKIETFKDTWKAIITYSDYQEQTVGMLGDTLLISNNSISINPSGYAPLSALVKFSTPVEGKVKIVIEGKTGGYSSITHSFNEYGFNHTLQIHGLYAGYENKVKVIFTNKDGEERVSTLLNITTPSLSDIIMPAISITKAETDKMEPGFTLVSYPGESDIDPSRPFIFDPDGEIRWLLDFKNHPLLGNLYFGQGMERLKNGNLYFGDIKTHAIYEIDMFGNILNQWDLVSLGYNFHHNVQEMPNGNFLITVTKLGSKHELGNYVIYDFIIELDRETGSVVTEWDLKESLDEWREAQLRNPLEEQTAAINWAHINGVIPCEDSDDIILTARFQGIVKLTRDNKVKWIIAPHYDWGTNRRGEDLNKYLLQPVDHLGVEITDTLVINGMKSHPDFEWWWGGHAPFIMPNGNLIAFDNGFKRNFSSDKLYSRAVEYSVNESTRQIKQVWQYGKERGVSTYAFAVSDVDYLPETGHILFCPGLRTPNHDGLGGKIIEVEYQTSEVVFEAEITTSNGFSFLRAERMFVYP